MLKKVNPCLPIATAIGNIIPSSLALLTISKTPQHNCYSFPPSSLDRRCFEFNESPKKVVGCRAGNRYFERVWCFFGNLKDSKNWSAKNTKIPHQSKISQKVSTLFQNICWFLRIYLCFNIFKKTIVQTYQDSTPEEFFGNARRYQLFWTHQISTTKLKISFTFVMSGSAHVLI